MQNNAPKSQKLCQHVISKSNLPPPDEAVLCEKVLFLLIFSIMPPLCLGQLAVLSFIDMCQSAVLNGGSVAMHANG